MKVFKKTSLLLTVVILAVVLSIGAIAGATMLAEGDETLGEEYAGVQVTTSGKVSLKFYYSTYGDATAFKAEVIDPVTTQVRQYSYPVEELEDTGNGYCVSVPLAPSEMTHTVRVYAVTDEKQSTAIEYSVREYALDVLKSSKQSESYKDAMRALLNWGSMSQTRYEDATSLLAVSGIFSKGTNPIYGLNTITTEQGPKVDGNAIKAATWNLSLEPDNLALHFYVNYTGEGKLTATVSKNGGEAVPTSVVKQGDGTWRVRLANIPANLFDTPYTITITDGSDTFTATKTVREYLGKLLDQCNNDGDLATGNVARALYQFYQVVTPGVIDAECNHTNRMYWFTNFDGTDSYKCADCFVDFAKVKVPEEAVLYYTPFDLSLAAGTTNKYQPRSKFQIVTSYSHGGEVAYTTITGDKETERDGQLLWQRVQADMIHTQLTGAQQKYTVDAGNAKYFVIKVRTNDATKRMALQFSTTGKNGPTKIADEAFINSIPEGKTYFDVDGGNLELGDTYATAVGYRSIKVPFDKAPENGWQTYVIDLESVIPEYYIKENGSYIIDTFYLHFSSISKANSFDIAYMAFVDGGLDSVKELVGDADSYCRVVGVNGESNLVSTETGKCLTDHAYMPTAVDGTCQKVCQVCGDNAGAVDHTVAKSGDGYKCSICNTTLNINYHVLSAAPYKGSVAQGYDGNVVDKYEEGMHYKAITFESTYGTMFNFIGSNYGGEHMYTPVIDTGRYLVVKMRGSVPAGGKLPFCTATQDNGYDQNSKINPKQTAIGNFTADTMPSEWTVVVIDLESVVGYSINTTQKIAFSTATGDGGTASSGVKFDLAYVVVVDDLADLSAFVSEQTVRFYRSGNVSNAYSIYDIEKMSCVEHHYAAKVVDGTCVNICMFCDHNGGAAEHDYAAEAVDGTCVNICQRCDHNGGAAEHDYAAEAVDGTCVNICQRCDHNGGAAEHSNCKVRVVDGVYKYTCGVCSTVVKDYQISTDVANTYWPAESLLGLGSYQAACDRMIVTEGDQTFFRVTDATGSAAWQGWFPYQSTSGSVTGRYLVMKIRRNDTSLNTVDMGFWVTSKESYNNRWDQGSFRVPLASDGQWHTIVIDLAARSSMYAPNASDGIYTLRTMHIRVFGDGAKTGATSDALCDIEYMAFFDDISEVKDIVKEDSYEWNVSNEVSTMRKTADNSCVTCSYKETITGNNRVIKCTLCGGILLEEEIPADVNFFVPLEKMSKMTHQLSGYLYDEENDVVYRSYTGSGGNHLNITGGSGAGSYSGTTATMGRYVVMKYRATSGASAGTEFGLKISSNKITGNDLAETMGGRTVSNFHSDWTVVVMDLSNRANYTVGEDGNFYAMITTSGNDYKIDIAYMAVVDTLDEIELLLEPEEKYVYLGRKWSNVGCEYGIDDFNPDCTYVYTTDETSEYGYNYVCSKCGRVNTEINLFKYQFYNGYFSTATKQDGYYTFTNSQGCHLNIGCDAAASTGGTQGKYSVVGGRYMAIKIRGSLGSALAFRISNQADATGADSATYGTNIGSIAKTAISEDEWRIFIVDLSQVDKGYVVGRQEKFMLATTGGGSAGQIDLDVAWIALGDSIDEFKPFFDEDVYYDFGTSFSNAPVIKDKETDECIHTSKALKLEAVGNSYRVVCSCGEITYDYNIDKSVAVPRASGNGSLFRDGEAIGKYTNCSTSVDNAVTAPFNHTYDILEAGSPEFTRFNPNPNMKEDSARRGRNMLGGKVANGANYLVIKYRIGKNGFGQNYMKFYVGAETESNAMLVKVVEDNQWHTVVIDLRARVGNGTVFDGNFTAENKEIWFQPFGDVSREDLLKDTSVYVDFAYAAACTNLADVAKLVGSDTYEWSVSSTQNEIRNTADLVAVAN